MDIVLIQLPFYGIRFPPLGLALLKSYLKQNNISCKVIDANIEAYRIKGKRYIDYWDTTQGYNFYKDAEEMLEYYKKNRTYFLCLMDEIKKLNPRIVGCSCQESSFIISKLFLEDLRNCLPNFKHILGGPHVASFMNNADELLATDYIDAINLDEGEVSLTSYFHAIKKDAGDQVAGLVYKKDGHIIRGGPTIHIKDLDELPFPDFSDFNFNNYTYKNAVPSYTSRCCMNRCIYCNARNYMKPFRFRSAKRIFEEVKYQKDKYPGINYVGFLDNASNYNIKELEEFCDLMIKSRLGLGWGLTLAVIRKEMRTPLYRKLKKAGCNQIGYGMETFSPRLLDYIGKVLSKDVDIVRVLDEGKKAGIHIRINTMFGLPGETEKDFNLLLKFLRRHHRSFDEIYPSMAFCVFVPGSEGRDNPAKYGLDFTKGPVYWESADKTNTYLIRMKRFELFCKIAKKYRLVGLKSEKELSNRSRRLFEYYFINKEYDKALSEYGKVNLLERTAELKKMYKAIKANDFTVLRNDPIKLRDVLQYGKTFKETFLTASLAENINNLKDADAFDAPSQKPWNRMMRSLIHSATSYDTIKKKVNNIYSLLKIIDDKIRRSVESGGIK